MSEYEEYEHSSVSAKHLLPVPTFLISKLLGA